MGVREAGELDGGDDFGPRRPNLLALSGFQGSKREPVCFSFFLFSASPLDFYFLEKLKYKY